MPTVGKTILANLAGTRIRIAILAFFPLLLIPIGFYSLVITYPAIVDAVATSDPHEDFQAALDAFHKKYGFPGATAAYVLRDGTTGVAATGLSDIEDGTLMTVRSRMQPVLASLGVTIAFQINTAASRGRP